MGILRNNAHQQVGLNIQPPAWICAIRACAHARMQQLEMKLRIKIKKTKKILSERLNERKAINKLKS